MTTMRTDRTTEDEFAELDELEVIETTELKLSGSYHAYTYYAVADMEAASSEATTD